MAMYLGSNLVSIAQASGEGEFWNFTIVNNSSNDITSPTYYNSQYGITEIQGSQSIQGTITLSPINGEIVVALEGLGKGGTLDTELSHGCSLNRTVLTVTEDNAVAVFIEENYI